MDQDLKCALITGSSSGIGEALARRFAPEAKVILHGRNLERLRAVRSTLPNPESHLIWNQDLEQALGVGSSLSSLLGETGLQVATFIHCAEECCLLPVARIDPVTARRLFQVNVFSATAIVRTLLRKNVNLGALRSIVFTSCIASRFGARGFGIYAATKGAVDSLSKSLAAELAPNVRVNSVLSGYLPTRDNRPCFETELAPKVAKSCLLGAGGADDVAAMAQYLASDQARWITGQQFVVDGGTTAH